MCLIRSFIDMSIQLEIPDNVAQALRRDLDDGEAEAIALSLQLGFDTVLIDEHNGRSIARPMGPRPLVY
jgi:predicted nucleic acid-binding protein